jgi:hypothetical protein
VADRIHKEVGEQTLDQTWSACRQSRLEADLDRKTVEIRGSEEPPLSEAMSTISRPSSPI